MTGGSLFYAVSGLRCAGRSTLCKQLESVLPETFPGYEFAFLGSPLGNLPHPFSWQEQTCKQHATTRLFECWARLNEFSVSVLRPALHGGKVVVVDGFGLDAVLYATARTTCIVEIDEAFELHKQLVQARIKAQGIAPPTYFIVDADAEVISSRTGLSNGVVSIHKLAEMSAIERYFKPEYGQKEPVHLRAKISAEDRLAQVIHSIREVLAQERVQTA